MNQFISYLAHNQRLVMVIFVLFSLNGFNVKAQSNDSIYIKEKVYIAVEKMPVFPGGPSELYSYLSSNVIIPQHLKDAGIEGLAVISFVVNKNGKIKGINILKSIHEDLDKELTRVIQSMPTWEPGMQSGKMVNVKYTVPFRISIK